MHIIAIRHLATPWNLEKKLQGRRDISIVQPIEANAQNCIAQRRQELFANPADDMQVYTSELSRTKQTANAYGFQQFCISPLLNELDFGKFEGLHRNQLITELEPSWSENPLALTLGEPLEALQQRIIRFMQTLPDVSTIVLFCHGSWMRGLASVIQQGDINAMNRLTLDNNALLEWHVSSFTTRIKEGIA